MKLGSKLTPAWATAAFAASLFASASVLAHGSANQPGESAEHSAMGEHLTKAEIKDAQNKLNQEGFNVGPADGIMGKKTQAAVKNYQQQNNLQANGKLDSPTLTKLGVQTAQAGQAEKSMDQEQPVQGQSNEGQTAQNQANQGQTEQGSGDQSQAQSGSSQTGNQSSGQSSDQSS